MATAATAHGAHDAHDHPTPTGWRRFVYSTNHKDIGTMYLVFAIIGGLIGGVVDRHRMNEHPGAPSPASTLAPVQRVHHRARLDHDFFM